MKDQRSKKKVMFNPKVPLLGELVPRIRQLAEKREDRGGFYSNENLKFSLFFAAVLNIVAPVI